MIWLDDINTLRLSNILRVSHSVILSSKSSHDHHRYDQPIWTEMFYYVPFQVWSILNDRLFKPKHQIYLRKTTRSSLSEQRHEKVSQAGDRGLPGFTHSWQSHQISSSWCSIEGVYKESAMRANAWNVFHQWGETSMNVPLIIEFLKLSNNQFSTKNCYCLWQTIFYIWQLAILVHVTCWKKLHPMQILGLLLTDFGTTS